MTPRCDMRHRGCTNAATVCAHVHLKPGGIAFYYACDDHSDWVVGQRTDMSEVVSVRAIDGSGGSGVVPTVEQARARGERGSG